MTLADAIFYIVSIGVFCFLLGMTVALKLVGR